jgi:hypothetical protein
VKPLTRDERQALFAISRENIYRTYKDTIVRIGRNGSNMRCDKAVRSLMDRGLVEPPPEGASFYTLTDAALPYLREPEPIYLGGTP